MTLTSAQQDLRKRARALARETIAPRAAEVDRRLAAYRQLETDPAIDAELRRIIRSGLMEPDRPLPEIPVAPEPVLATGSGTGERRHNRRREAAARPAIQEDPAS